MPKTTLSQLVSELKQPSVGRMLIIEGPRAGRLHLANAIGAQLGYGIRHEAVIPGHTEDSEKNYAQLIAGANHLNSILFFDEADALFGNRTAVKDAHDRYANPEVSFRGLIILGADNKYSLRSGILERSRVIMVRDHWPPS